MPTAGPLVDSQDIKLKAEIIACLKKAEDDCHQKKKQQQHNRRKSYCKIYIIEFGYIFGFNSLQSAVVSILGEKTLSLPLKEADTSC